jgi:hypothetical protein
MIIVSMLKKYKNIYINIYMPIHNNIYYQHQFGGLCRLHSLNAFFGNEKITTSQFNTLQNLYDKEYADKFNIDVSCKTFDIISSNQKNIVSYILKKFNVYTRYYAINQLYKKSIKENILDIIKGDFFFIYTDSHIWGVRKNNDNNWFMVDSIRGVFSCNINNLTNEKNIGFIIPTNIKTEFYINLELINVSLNSVCVNNDYKLESIKNYLIQKHDEKKILDELEIPLGICMDILETNLLKKNNTPCELFNPIKYNVIKYNEFMNKFTNGRYTDITLILEYLPELILDLILILTK